MRPASESVTDAVISMGPCRNCQNSGGTREDPSFAGAGRAGTTHLLQVAGRGGVGDAGQEHGEPEEEGARHGAAAFSHFCPF